MNTLLKILLLNLFLLTICYSQHIPLCMGNAHNGRICYGYATARAFNRGWNDPVCPASDLYLTKIQTTYFQHHSNKTLSEVLSEIHVGDIVEFDEGDHVAYVSSISTRDVTGIKVDQVEGPYSSEQTYIQLSWVISGHYNPNIQARGNPIGYFRKRPRWSMWLANEQINGNDWGTVGIAKTGGIVEYNSPHLTTNIHWETQYTLDAVMHGHEYGGYVRIFDRWSKEFNTISTNKTTNITILDWDFQEAKQYRAHFIKEFNITIQNNFQGIGNTGIIKVDGVEYNLPHAAFPVTQNESITAQALYQVHNFIEYVFSEWHDDNTSSQRTFEPTNHATYTAYYSGRPKPVTIISAGGEPGTHVFLEWEEHPNSYVDKYEIWRMVKPASGGSWIGPTKIATKNRGYTSYTDIDYENTATWSHDLLKYDIRAHYSIENSYAAPNWVYVNGNGMIQKRRGVDQDHAHEETVPATSSLTQVHLKINKTQSSLLNLGAF